MRSFSPLLVLALSTLPLAGLATQAPTTQAAKPPATAPADQRPRETIRIAGDAFSLETARDAPSRAKGLMDRTSIDDRGGMLFIFEDALPRSFWMVNCVVDIDLIFLDAAGRITALHEMKVETPKRETESQSQYERRMKSYESRRPAQFAIELKAGSIARLKLKLGDKIEMDVKRLAKLAR
jgi:uncharacterized protein